ncbi:hypothetical protein SeMB42_g04479 [Synchytrium endobioticum]|uniref:Uncharacterized protein n=1 Tax=Synchytrium endobioticum TaxID=286115 RepID=A0A507CXQ2_9FUNG|nr:hypothetical protein SeMB42_g04479 [Synchytrium endobioticum]
MSLDMVPIPDLSSEDMVTLGLIIFDDGALSVNSKTSPPTDITPIFCRHDNSETIDCTKKLKALSPLPPMPVSSFGHWFSSHHLQTPHNLYLHPDIVLFRTSVL